MTRLAGAGNQAATQARRAGDSRALRTLARLGLAAQGLVYLLVALIAAQVAASGGSGRSGGSGGSGGSGKSADQSGALATVAAKPFGTVVLWVVALGLFGFALWQLTTVAWGTPEEADDKDDDRMKKALARAGAACVAVAYAGLGFTALKLATGSGSKSSSSSGEKAKTSTVLSWPGGQFLVAIAGLVIVGIGGYFVVKGFRSAFEKRMLLAELDARVRSAVRRLGQVGYVAKGVTFAIAGILVVVAAVRYQPGKAGGLDTALRTLAGQPYGSVLLGLVALGLACFGVFCFADARYRRL